MNENNQNDVVKPDVNKFPYGVKITIFVNGEIKFDIENKLYELAENLTLKFVQNDTTTSQYTEVTFAGYQVWDVHLEGFKTACEAEEAGIKLAESFLWISISKKFPIRLIYNKKLPCSIYDRTKGVGFELSGFGHMIQALKSEDVIKGVKDILSGGKK